MTFKKFILWILIILTAIMILSIVLLSIAYYRFLQPDSDKNIWICIFIGTIICMILSLTIILSIVNSLKYEWKNILEAEEKNEIKQLNDQIKALRSIFDDAIISKLKSVDKTELSKKIDELVKK